MVKTKIVDHYQVKYTNTNKAHANYGEHYMYRDTQYDAIQLALELMADESIDSKSVTIVHKKSTTTTITADDIVALAINDMED